MSLLKTNLILTFQLFKSLICDPSFLPVTIFPISSSFATYSSPSFHLSPILFTLASEATLSALRFTLEYLLQAPAFFTTQNILQLFQCQIYFALRVQGRPKCCNGECSVDESGEMRECFTLLRSFY